MKLKSLCFAKFLHHFKKFNKKLTHLKIAVFGKSHSMSSKHLAIYHFAQNLQICIYVFREKNEDIIVDCRLLHSSDEKEIIIGGSGNICTLKRIVNSLNNTKFSYMCVYRLNKMIVLGLSRFHKDSASYALVVVKNITLIKSLA